MKQHLAKILSLTVLLTVWTSFPVHAQISGQTKGGAYYTIAVPATWNGSLVIWNHGYSFSPVSPDPDLGPLAGVQLAQGYAVAASSYRQSQWAVFSTRHDLEELVRTFGKKVGIPDSIIMTGASLGGIVTADVLERSKIPRVDGAFTFCGAMAGSRAWDGAIDIRLTYDAICGDIAPIPGGATGLPGLPGMPGVIDPTAVAVATNACMGTLVPAAFRTPLQQDNLDRFLAVTKIPESFINIDMGFATNGLSDVTFDEHKLNGRKGTGNIHVKYDDAAVNASIERVKANHKGGHRLQKNFTPRGRLQNRHMKIVSMHTDKDGLVIVENESEYQKVVRAKNLTVGVAIEAASTHCGFTESELLAGWESLRAWVAGAPQPSAAVLQGTCQVIEASGLAAGPCRIDPTYVIGDMDDRIAPRHNAGRHKRWRHHHH